MIDLSKGVLRPIPRPRSLDSHSSSAGLTYLEMVATAAILMILASAILPMARVTLRRTREIELRRELRSLRTAIDRYHQAVLDGKIGGTDVKLGSNGYPPDLDVLVEGVNQVGRVDGVKLKFLRRVPKDPVTGTEAPAQQPMLMKLLQPLGIVHVGLSVGDILDVVRISPAALEAGTP